MNAMTGAITAFHVAADDQTKTTPSNRQRPAMPYAGQAKTLALTLFKRGAGLGAFEDAIRNSGGK
jgi:hypothetical protein